MLSILSGVFNAIANFFGFAKDSLSVKNTPELQSNAEAKTVEKEKAKAIQDVNNNDLTDLRNDVAE